MFKKIFGGSKPEKEEKPKEVPQAQPLPDYQIQFEKISFEIKQQEENFENKIDKFTEKIDNLRNLAKECAKKGQKKQAQFKLQEIQQLEQYITRAENQKQIFLKVRMQLENGLENKNATETLSKAADLLKKTNDFDKYQDALNDLADINSESQQIDQMIAQQAQQGIDQDQMDEDYEALMKEINQEEADKFQKGLNQVPNANVNSINHAQKDKPSSQQIQQNKNDQAFNDALMDQLAL